jgi:hypothetical protein
MTSHPPFDGDEPAIERRVLDLLPAPAAPTDFAEQVVALAARERPGRSRWRRGAVIATLAACAAIVALWLLATGPEEGRGRAAERTTWTLGARGVAVGEPGAVVSWTIHRGAASVVQSEGNVFYRVDRGHGPFEVSTPAGSVLVTGTCFRVEVNPMKERKTWLSAGAGAIGATVVLVGVYEGRVRFGNAQGGIEVRAGEQASASPEERPQRVVAQEMPAGERASATAGGPAPAASAPVGTEAERREIAALRARLRTLEAAAAAGPAASSSRDSTKFIDPSHDELVQRAKDCQLDWDSPKLDANPRDLEPKSVQELGLSEDEREIVNAVRKEVVQAGVAQLRQLYIEATGDRRGSEVLSLSGLQSEIISKSEGDVKDVYHRLSAERAGLPAPAPPGPSTPLERMVRLLTGLGDTYEKQLAAQLGPARAHDLRVKRNGWDSRTSWSYGCP